MTDEEFESFYAETAAPLHAYLSRAGGDAVLADDVLQSAYLRLLRADSVPRDPRPRRVYLFRTATNLLRDELRRGAARRRRAERMAAVEASGGEPSASAWGVERVTRAEAESFESRMEVHRALGEVRPRDRELLWLAYAMGLSHREISEVAGVGEGSVRVLLLRARKRFVKVLERFGVGPEDRE